MSFFSFLEKAQKEFGELAQVVAQDAQSLVKETKKVVGVSDDAEADPETAGSSSAQGTQDQAPPRPTLVPEEAIKRRDQIRAEEEERAKAASQVDVVDAGRRAEKEPSQIQETATNAAAWGDKLLKKGTMFLQQLSTDFQEEDANASEPPQAQGQQGTIAAPPAASGMIERPEIKKSANQQGDQEIVDNLLGQIGELDSAKKKLEIDVEDLRGVLATSQQTEDELRSALAEKQEIFTAMNNSLQDEVRTLQDQLKTAQESQSQTVEAEDASAARITELEEQLKAKNSSLHDQIKSLEDQLKTAQESQSQTVEAEDASAARITELEEQLKAKNSSLHDQIKSLEDQLKTAQESQSQTVEAEDASAARITELEEQLSAMEANAGMATIKEQQMAAQLKGVEEKHKMEILALEEQLEAASNAQSQNEESMNGQVSILTEKCAELEKAVAMAREMCAAAEEGRASADSARMKAEEELSEVSQKMAEHTAIQDAAKESNDSIDAILQEKERLDEACAALQEEKSKLHAEISRIGTDLEEAKAEVKESEEKAAAAEHEAEAAKCECEKLLEEHRSKVEAMESSLAAVESALDQKMKELEEKSNMCTDLESNLEQAKLDIDACTANAENELGPVMEQLQQVTRERDDANESVDALQSEVSSLKGKVGELENELSAAVCDLDDMKKKAAEMEDSNAKIAAAEEETERLKEELLAASNKQMDIASTEQELLGKIEKLESSLAEAISERDAAKDAVMKLEEQLKEKQNTAMGEKNALKSQLDDALQLVAEEKRKADAAEEALSELKSSEPSSGEDIGALKGECEQLKSTIMSLHDEVSTLKGSSGAERTRADKAEESVKSLKEEMEEMMNEYDVTIQQLRDELNEAKKAARSASDPVPVPQAQPVAVPSEPTQSAVPDDGPKSTESLKAASTWEKLSDDEGGWDEWE